ncbi:MAG: tryptophan-rich sensory protein [Candidatus Hodarchaeota archaeon]
MDEKKQVKILQISNIITTAIVLFVNFLGSTGILNNVDTGTLSDELPNLFVPAGLTFSVWGAIYTLLILFIFYQGGSLFKKGAEPSENLKKIGWFYSLINITNALWMITWHYRLVPLSLVIMLIFLVLLIVIYLRLKIGLKGETQTPKEKFFYQVPFSVYLGWITVATVANVTAVFIWAGVEPYTPVAVIWTILVIIVATLIAALVILTRKDIGYTLVIIWAFLGIVIKRMDPEYFVQLDVALTAGIALIFLAVLLIVVKLVKRKK